MAMLGGRTAWCVLHGDHRRFFAGESEIFGHERRDLRSIGGQGGRRKAQGKQNLYHHA